MRLNSDLFVRIFFNTRFEQNFNAPALEQLQSLITGGNRESVFALYIHQSKVIKNKEKSHFNIYYLFDAFFPRAKQKTWEIYTSPMSMGLFSCE